MDGKEEEEEDEGGDNAHVIISISLGGRAGKPKRRCDEV